MGYIKEIPSIGYGLEMGCKRGQTGQESGERYIAGGPGSDRGPPSLLLPLPLDRDTAFSGAGLTWALLWVALPGLLGEHLATLPTKLSWVGCLLLASVAQAEQVFLGYQELRGSGCLELV